MDNEVKMKVPVRSSACRVIIRARLLKGEVKRAKVSQCPYATSSSVGYSSNWPGLGEWPWFPKGSNVPVESTPTRMIAEVNKKFENYYSSVENNVVIARCDRMF